MRMSDKTSHSLRIENFWHLLACFCTHRGMQTHTQSQESVHPVDLAAMVEDRIHESLLNSPTAFHLDSARLYGVNIGPHAGTEELMLSFILENGDIYDLLDTPESACARLFDAAALVTCGWAAPLPASHDDESDDTTLTAPSEHPERRRVRLVVVVSDAGVGSVLRFEDDSDHPILDAGAARGPLADAVNSFWVSSSPHRA